MKKERIMNNGIDGGFIEITSEQQSSVKLGCNAGGGFSFEIKIYSDDPEKRKKEIEDTLEWVRGLVAKKHQENMGE